MDKEPTTYEELIRKKRCIDLTKYYELTMEELEEIYCFLENNPNAGKVKANKQNIVLINGDDLVHAKVLMANCISDDIDGIIMDNTIFKIIPHYTITSDSNGTGGSSSNNNNNNNNNNR